MCVCLRVSKSTAVASIYRGRGYGELYDMHDVSTQKFLMLPHYIVCQNVQSDIPQGQVS